MLDEKNIIEQFMAAGASSKELPWLTENEQRKTRWSKYFTGKLDLHDDRVLKNQGLSEATLNIIRRQTECLLDNTLSEAARASKGSLFETTTAGSDIETFTNVATQLIRKIWPRSFAYKMVSTQPMKAPTQKAFTLDFTAGSTHSPYTTASSLYDMNYEDDYSLDPGENAEPNEIDAKISGETITATSKKLKFKLTQEAIQDASAQYDVDLNPEMVKMMGMQLEREINRTLITAVSAAATHNTNWDTSQPTSGDPWANATPREYNESLWDAICDAEKDIFDHVYERANIILCGSTFGSRLQKLSSFRLSPFAPTASEAQGLLGPNLFGAMDSRLQVYVDPHYTADKAILAHKSDNWLYTGYVYMPYVPLWMTPDIHATTLTVSKACITRFGRYSKNGNFFSTITCTSL